MQVSVLAPHERGLARRETVGSMEVFAFAMPGLLRSNRSPMGEAFPPTCGAVGGCAFRCPFSCWGFCSVRAAAAISADLVHCHWTVSGLVALWALGRRKRMVLSVRGSDIHLLSGQWGRRLNRFIANRMHRVVAVSEDIANKLADAGVQLARTYRSYTTGSTVASAPVIARLPEVVYISHPSLLSCSLSVF